MISTKRPLRSRLALGALVVLVLAPLVITTAPATADHCGVTGGGAHWQGDCKHSGGSGGDGATPGDAEDPEDRGAVFAVESTVVDGERCWMITDNGSMTWAEATELVSSFSGNGTLYDTCDFGSGVPPSIWTWWTSDQCPPPPPTPVTLDPQNEAITGQPGYLTIGGDRTPPVPCLGQTIQAEARYVVDWGDGATTETTSQGGEWPDGDLTHVYENKGSYTITVEAYWTGTVGGTALPELPVPTTATAEVQVDEVQGVVTEQH